MKGPLLMSILFATIAIPIRAASDPQPERGVRRAVFGFLAFEMAYLLALLLIYPRLA
jgi:hypothetical protein